jgi:hypothetical protein
MLRTIEAILEPDGRVRLLEAVTLPGTRRALVTVLAECADDTKRNVTVLLSEATLSEDWSQFEEDAAWTHLQREASSLFRSLYREPLGPGDGPAVAVRTRKG